MTCLGRLCLITRIICGTSGRELFPTSDCLKASQREHMLYREILSHKAAICCLQVRVLSQSDGSKANEKKTHVRQEVDRTEKLFPVLEEANYACVYAAGPRKKHGCLIAYRKDTYDCVRQRVVTYDEQDVREEGDEKARRGLSFRTKNICSIVALRQRGQEQDGVIVATTHLFWHPA